MSTYGYTKQANALFSEVVQHTKEALAQAGFGVISEINMATTLQEKIGADIEPYVILGACDPTSALEAMRAELEIGLLLPCNVIVYQKAKHVYISAIKAKVLLDVTGNNDLTETVKTIEERLNQAIDVAAEQSVGSTA